ncbi:MAG: alpha/beta hydrolase [Bdellovibrionales bacterium]|nr:alpha/beta hydrolase [Bdellovibrionales bacterium]
MFLQNKLYVIVGFIFIFLFLFLGCNYANDDGINFSYESADLSEINDYTAADFIFAFFNSSFLSDNVDEDATLGITLTSVIGSESKDLRRLLKFKTEKVTGYEVEYSTRDPYSGREITASGLLLVPSSSRPLPLLVYHRATLLTKAAAPSLIPEEMIVIDPIIDERATMIMLALQGYIVLAPDYIGYGSSDDIRHPYLYRKSVTQTSLDMFFSVTEALKEYDISFTKDVYVMGYSQGGHGAIAFAQGFQDNNTRDFAIRALAAGGGPYDILETIRELFDQNFITKITTLLFLQAYTYIYNWDLDRIIRKNSYKDVIESAFEYEDIEEPAKEIPNKVDDLFRSQFIEDIQKGRSDSIQKNLEENSVYNWAPSVPVLLFHARNDRIVPYINMKIAYNSFNRNGSASVTRKDCSFKRLDNLLKAAKKLNIDAKKPTPNHVNCIFIFMLEASDFIKDF